MSHEERQLVLSQLDWFGFHLGALRNRLQEIDYQCGRNELFLTAEGSRAVVVLRRIVVALEERCEALRRIEQAGDSDAEAMLELTKRPLTLSSNPLHALVSEPPIPPIPVDSFLDTLNRLVQLVRPADREQRRRVR